MAKKENKVQFNLKNTHYAVLTVTEGVPRWGTPIKVPGAVALSLDPQGEMTPFYADGVVYYYCNNNNGYSGDLEMARFLDQMLIDVWGFVKDETDGVLLENSNAEIKAMALLFQIDGDADNQHYCLYNCMGTRPGITSGTNTQSKTPQTQKSTITASPLEDGNIMARTTAETSDEVRANWYKTVYQKKATTEATS